MGIKRKTLDDYYITINKGKQFGFDFQTEAKKKMGVLRKFIREKEKQAARNPSTSPNRVDFLEQNQ